MQLHIVAAGNCSTFPAAKVICRIDSAALWTRVLFDHFRIPCCISNRLDTLLGCPKLYSMRHLALKRLQFYTWVLRALAAKVQSLFCRAFGHFAGFVAIKPPLFRAAPMTFHILNCGTKATRQRFQSCRLLHRAYIYCTCGTKEPTYGRQFLFRGSRASCFTIHFELSIPHSNPLRFLARLHKYDEFLRRVT